jgi:hypothetical protein
MGHIILNLYCTFDKRYFYLLSDLLYETIVVFVFLFLCVGYLSQYFSKYYNIYFSLLGTPYNYRKNKYTLEYRHLGSNCCNALFTKNIMYNELMNETKFAYGEICFTDVKWDLYLRPMINRQKIIFSIRHL